MQNKWLIIPTILLLILSACNKDEAETDQQRYIDEYLASRVLVDIPIVDGIYYINEQEGSGASINKGDKVQVQLSCYMLSQKVDGNYRQYYSNANTQPDEITVQADNQMLALYIALPLMRVGGKATLLVPSAQSYGSKQVGNIPPYTPLLIELEVINLTE